MISTVLTERPPRGSTKSGVRALSRAPPEAHGKTYERKACVGFRDAVVI